jgi:hypothetical protein
MRRENDAGRSTQLAGPRHSSLALGAVLEVPGCLGEQELHGGGVVAGLLEGGGQAGRARPATTVTWRPSKLISSRPSLVT